MTTTKLQTAKIFQSGGSQAVRIPKEFRFDETEVYITRTGEGILLTPKSQNSKQVWLEWAERLAAYQRNGVDDDAFVIERGGPPQEREGLDEVFP